MIPTMATTTPTTNSNHGLAAGLSASMKKATTADAKPAIARSQGKACFTATPVNGERCEGGESYCARRSRPRWASMPYSMTWSACTSNDDGIVRPSTLAV